MFNRQFEAEGSDHHNITVDWGLLGYGASLQVACSIMLWPASKHVPHMVCVAVWGAWAETWPAVAVHPACWLHTRDRPLYSLDIPDTAGSTLLAGCRCRCGIWWSRLRWAPSQRS